MFSKTKAKRFALGLALALALAAAPQSLAGPGAGGDLGSAVYGWLADLWLSVSSIVVTHDEMGGGTIPNGSENNFGPRVGPNGGPTDFGPVATPNGLSSESGNELGAIVPDGDQTYLDAEEEEYGPYIIPSG